MTTDTTTEKPTWFTVKKVKHYPGRIGTPGVDNYEVSYRTIDRLYDSRTSWGGDFGSRAEAIASGKARGWTFVSSFKEAKDLATPILDAQRARSAQIAAARAGMHVVRIDVEPGSGRSYGNKSHLRYVTPEIAAVLLELLGEGDEHKVVHDLSGPTQTFWKLPEPKEYT